MTQPQVLPFLIRNGALWLMAAARADRLPPGSALQTSDA